MPTLARALRALPLLAAAACAPAAGPATPTPSPASPDEAAAPAAFAYAEGTHRYALESRAAVEVRGDTSRMQDSLATTAFFTFRVSGGDDPRRLVGTVDSFTVRPAGPLASSTPSTGLVAPIPFSGTVKGGDVEVSIPPEVATNCASPAGVLLAAASDLLPSFPAALGRGARWEEVVTTTACRGGVPMTSVSTHRYRVLGAAEGAGPDAVRVERRTSVSLTGRGTQAGQTVSTQGRGEGESEFIVSVRDGTVLSGSGRSELELAFTASGRTERVTQRSEQRLRRLER